MTNPSLPLAHELIRTACSAPSVHNTQPWSWRVLDAATIELYADRSRQLLAIDPGGRDLAISCGAALHHMVVAAEAFGLCAEVVLLPLRENTELLARTHITPGRIETESVDMLAALEDRLTDRRGFSTWDVPATRLSNLCEAAAGWGAQALPLTDPWVRHRTEELLEQARRTQAADPQITEEQRIWTDSLDSEAAKGIPTENTAPRPRAGTTHRPSRFEPLHKPASAGVHTEDGPQPDPTDGLVAICTTRDDLRAWLQAGQAMSAVCGPGCASQTTIGEFSAPARAVAAIYRG